MTRQEGIEECYYEMDLMWQYWHNQITDYEHLAYNQAFSSNKGYICLLLHYS
jgi:hypothetical protein